MSNRFTPEASLDLGGPEWLTQRRLRAIESLKDIEWPTADEEIWRYSRVGDIDLTQYRPMSGAELGQPGVDAVPGGGPVAAELGARSALIVVRDGRVVHHEIDPALEARGVVVGDLAMLDADTAVGRVGLTSDASPDAFTLLHDAFLAGGAYIHVPRGVVVEQPIVVIHWCDGEGVASFPHTIVIAEELSQVSVLERFGSPNVVHLVDGVVELILGDGANVRYQSVQEYGDKTTSIALQRAHLGRDAVLHSSAVALGGSYARLRSESLLEGVGAESEQVAVYYGDNDQMLDFRTLQDHAAPNTTSNLLFKGAVEDTARSVYSGMVHIRPEAQKSRAVQSNRNLVLTEGAGAESIPNLVIEADDVRCAHASAVGPIDEDQRYYLATRGVPPEEAERLIVLGFFEDVFERLPVPALVGPLRRSVQDKIGNLHAGLAHA